MLRVTSTLVIDESELEERFVRSSGPGGQNVNKVATAVQLSFNASSSPSLDEGTQERLPLQLVNAVDGVGLPASDGWDATRNRTNDIVHIRVLL